MRRWLFRFGPLRIPTEGRVEMEDAHINRSDLDFADFIWDTRDAIQGVPEKSHKRGWPIRQNVVTRLKARGKS